MFLCAGTCSSARGWYFETNGNFGHNGVEEKRKTCLRTYFLTYFETFPRNLLLSYFWATLFFSGISGLVAHRAVTNLVRNCSLAAPETAVGQAYSHGCYGTTFSLSPPNSDPPFLFHPGRGSLGQERGT